jgi:hypothetical protein
MVGSEDVDDWGQTSEDDTFHGVDPAEPMWSETV